jgi:hypothetical protein
MSIFDSKPYQLIEFYLYQLSIIGWSVLLYRAALKTDWITICICTACILATCETVRRMAKKTEE